MPQLADISGERFGRLTVIRRVSSNAHGRIYECRCDCGQVTQVAAHYLRNGHTKSCGCLSRELAKAHGVARRKWTFPNPKCNVEGCQRRGQNMWQRLHPRAMAVKGTGGEQTVTIYNFHCALQKPARSLHSEYVGPHGEPVTHSAKGHFSFTDSASGILVETESSHARAMADPARRKKMSKGLKRSWKEHREARLQATRISNANPIRRAKISAAGRRRWANLEERQKYSAAGKQRWASLTPAQRRQQTRRQMRGCRTPEAMQRKSESLKRAWTEKKAKLAALRKAAENFLPPDWMEKEPIWVLVGITLLKDRMTNKELASRLDKFVKCPYAVRWSEYFGTRAGKVQVNRIGKWVGKRGVGNGSVSGV